MKQTLFYYEWQANFKTATEKGIKEANLMTTVTVILVLTAGKLTTRAKYTDLVRTAGKPDNKSYIIILTSYGHQANLTRAR